MSKKSVPFTRCKHCGKRAFHSEHAAQKALGRAQARRDRVADAIGTRRGVRRETRYYDDCGSGLFHLTATSRRRGV